MPANQSLDAFTQACRAIGEPILGKPVSEISIARLLVQLFQTTETFEMETQPQLLLLQKTMVTAEGVAQSLDPDVNFWEVSHPTVESWMRENMGPEAKLADFVNDGLTFAKKLPALVAKTDALLTRIEERSEQVLAGLDNRQSEKPRPDSGWIFLLGALSGAVALYLVLSF